MWIKKLSLTLILKSIDISSFGIMAKIAAWGAICVNGGISVLICTLLVLFGPWFRDISGSTVHLEFSWGTQPMATPSEN